MTGRRVETEQLRQVVIRGVAWLWRILR